MLQDATGTPATVMEQALAPALEEGVLLSEPGVGEAVRPATTGSARRSWPAGPGAAAGLAAGDGAAAGRSAGVVRGRGRQYLPVTGAVEDPAERRQVAGLLRRAASQAALTGDYALVDALLAAALRLTGPEETAALIEARTARHAALFSLGRLEEADEEYRAIEALCRAC